MMDDSLNDTQQEKKMSVKELDLYWKLGDRNLHVEKEDDVIKVSIRFGHSKEANTYLDLS